MARLTAQELDGFRDDFSRLISTNYNSGGYVFNDVYDRYGNRWQQNMVAGGGAEPQLAFNAATNQINTSGYTYDAAGNVTNDGFHTYTWDAENNILTVDNGSTDSYTRDWSLGHSPALGLPDAGCEFGACGGGFGFPNTPVHGVWQYGHWCGAGGMATPINPVDNFCMLHDLNLNKLKLDWTVFQSEANFSKLSPDQQRQIQEYGQELCDGEASVQIPWWNISEMTAAAEIGAFFHSHVPKGARCH